MTALCHASGRLYLWSNLHYFTVKHAQCISPVSLKCQKYFHSKAIPICRHQQSGCRRLRHVSGGGSILASQSRGLVITLDVKTYLMKMCLGCFYLILMKVYNDSDPSYLGSGSVGGRLLVYSNHLFNVPLGNVS